MKETGDNKVFFQANAPYNSNNMSNEKAFGIIAEQKENIRNLRKREEQMKFGFDLFKINYGTSPDLEFLEKELASLEEVWNTKEEWDKYVEKV